LYIFHSFMGAGMKNAQVRMPRHFFRKVWNLLLIIMTPLLSAARQIQIDFVVFHTFSGDWSMDMSGVLTGMGHM